MLTEQPLVSSLPVCPLGLGDSLTGVPGAGVTGAGVTGAAGVVVAGVTGGGVTGAGVVGSGVTGAGVVVADVTGAGVNAGVVGAGVVGAGVAGLSVVVTSLLSSSHFWHLTKSLGSKNWNGLKFGLQQLTTPLSVPKSSYFWQSSFSFGESLQ